MNEELEEKKAEIKEELDKLQYEFKVELPKLIAEARAYGDLKENAEYHAARERQSFVKARIGQLSDQLNKLTSLDVDSLPQDEVAFGSEVTICVKGSSMRFNFKFVGENEVNPSQGKISLSSPYGTALKGKKVGDEVEVTVPAGIKVFVLEKLKTIHGTEFSI